MASSELFDVFRFMFVPLGNVFCRFQPCGATFQVVALGGSVSFGVNDFTDVVFPSSCLSPCSSLCLLVTQSRLGSKSAPIFSSIFLLCGMLFSWLVSASTFCVSQPQLPMLNVAHRSGAEARCPQKFWCEPKPCRLANERPQPAPLTAPGRRAASRRQACAGAYTHLRPGSRPNGYGSS